MQRVVKSYYGFQFFFSLLLWVPVFYDFQKRIGLSDGQIFAIQSLYYLAFTVLEIPTGFLADRIGHVRCMRAGAWLLVLCNLLPALFRTYNGMLWHFLLIALSRSLISGASSAYIYERLREAGDSATFKQVEGNARAYGLVGKVVCWAGVGYLMQWNLTLPYWLTALSAAISVVFAYRLPAPKGALESAAKAGKTLELLPAFRLLGAQPMLILIMIQGVSVFVLARILQVNLFQPILSEKHFALSSYGIIMSVTTIFEAIGSAFPGYLRKWLSDLNSVFVLTLTMALSMSFMALSEKGGVVVWMSVFALATGFSFPIQRQLLNDAIPEAGAPYRATLLSMESIVDRAACAWVASILGAYVAGGRTFLFLHLSAAASMIAMLILFVAMNRKSSVEEAAAEAGLRVISGGRKE